jgi:hypothetical protein
MVRIIVVNARRLMDVPSGYMLVYVGRRTSYQPEYGEDFSILGNPNTLRGGHTRDEAVELYAPWLDHAPPYVRQALDVLRQRTVDKHVALVCFCAPLRCHADVIKAQLESTQ